jgi:Mce-associated membrane protein
VGDPGARTVGAARMMRLRPRGSATTISAVLATLVLGGLLAIAGERGLTWQERREQRAAAEAASEVAAAQVEKLITVSSSTAEASIDSLLDGATGDFRTELEAQTDRLRGAVADSKVAATGEVVSTGVVTAEEDSVTVVVAATGSVRNTNNEEPEPRNYRLSVDLEKVDGRWLVSGLEFVA